MHCGAILKCKTHCHALIIRVSAPSAKKAAFHAACLLADLLRLGVSRTSQSSLHAATAFQGVWVEAVEGGVHNEESLCEGGYYFPGTMRGFAQATPICWKSVAGSFRRLRTPGHTHRKLPDNSCILRI